MATLDQLYRQVLGRAPDTEGYEYWAREFGPTIEPDEVQTFLRGAVASGEAPTTSALQSQAQTFLSSIPVTPVLTGATTADVAGPPVSASSGSLRNTAEQIVRNAFQDVLGRQPLQGGLDYWTNELLNNPAKTATIAQDIAYGAQGADQTAADRWAQQNLGKSIFAVPTTQDTTKTTTNTSTGLSQRAIAEQMVRDAYQDVLGRQPLPDGLNYWVNEILEGRSSGESLSQNIAYGAQNPADMEAASAWFKRSGIGTQPPVDTTGTVTDTGTTTDTGAQPSLVPTGAANQGLATPNQVRAMYLSMLNREPDQAGYQYWTNQPIENLRQTFLNASVPEMTRRVAEIPVTTTIPKPLMGTTPPGAANVSVEIPGQFVTTDQGAPKPLTVDISKMAPEQQALTNLIAARMPRPSAPAAGPIFTPGEVSAQLELERLKAMNAPATPAETPVAGFAQGGLVGNDINRMLQNQRNSIQRESQSRQMLNTLGAPPVKKFSDGGPAGSPSSGVRRLKMSGYADGGEVTDEMFTGTLPTDQGTSPGILPPEIRQAIDVPLDFANMAIRGTVGAVAGPAYGLYKGLTSDKFGTKEGVSEARSEAERMMGQITGEPKTQQARDIMDFVGEKLEAAKVPPMPQFLTTPLPAPGSARAAMRSYELAQEPPTGAITLDPLGMSSRLSEAVDKLQARGTGEQLLAQLNKAQGVPQAEIKATGLDEFLKSAGKVTRDDIQNYLEKNRVNLIEDERSFAGAPIDSLSRKTMGSEFPYLSKDFFNRRYANLDQVKEAGYNALKEQRDELQEAFTYGDMRSFNDRDGFEVLPDELDDWFRRENDYLDQYIDDIALEDSKVKHNQLTLPGGENYREVLFKLPTREGEPSFVPPASHYEDATNTFGSIRMTDRVVDGKPILFAEEVQSDWAIKGAKQGYDNPETATRYKNELKKANQVLNQLTEKMEQASRAYYGRTAEDNSLELLAKLEDAKEQRSKVERFRNSLEAKITPENPFKNNWYQPVMNRFLIKAAQEGKEGIGLTNGEVHIQRYSLRNYADKLKYNPDLKLLEVFRNAEDENPMRIFQNVDKDRLGKQIGQNMADKLLSSKTEGNEYVLQGDQLEVGGSGKNTFYDKILPDYLNKLGKKYGVKVETRTLPAFDQQQKSAVNPLGNISDEKAREIYYLPITEEMRNDLLGKGLPTFAEGGEVTNEQFIQEMMTGTAPSDTTTNPGILPPEIRQAIDVPLDFANLLIRGTAAVPIGGAAGLYKGLTGGKYGTREGVTEARSEAERMMSEITGEPKTQEVRDVLDFVGQKLQEYKLDAPMPQLLTLPAPGAGTGEFIKRGLQTEFKGPPIGTLKLADEMLPESGETPTPGGATIRPEQLDQLTSQTVIRGRDIPPLTKPPTPEEIQVAKADTRMGQNIVADRLNIIVPETERVREGVYRAGQPNGRPWSELTAEQLKQRDSGFKGTDNDLERMWQETLSEVSEAGRIAVDRTGATWKAFPAKDWDSAFKLPLRNQLWYELSGEAFVDRMPDTTTREMLTFLDLIGATSARAKPLENLERSVAISAQKLQGVPVDVDVTIPSTVKDALRREGTNISSDLANKTGNFSDTLALTGGLPVRYPISVNDVWVGNAFGITDQQLGANQALHEVFARYMNKVRDFHNQTGNPLFPHESWQVQARQWVEMRAKALGIDTSKLDTVEGSDYAAEFDKVVKKLENAGISVPDGILTRDVLMDPRVPDALRTTTKAFREAPKATVEFGTLLTPSGKRGAELFEAAKAAGDELTQKEYLKVLTSSMYDSARGKPTPWQNLVRVATNRAESVTRIYSPTSQDPFAISGTFQGAAGPNIRIPFRDMTPDQIAYANAVAGLGLKQKAMAAAEIRRLNPGDALPEGFVETNSLKFEIDGPVPESLLVDITKELGEGYEVSAMRYPDGVVVDINPKFGDAGPEAPSIDNIDRAVDMLQERYGAKDPRVFNSAFRSEFGKNYVEDPGTGAEYNRIIKETLKGWNDEAITRIIDLAGNGVKRSDVSKFLAGKLDTLPVNSKQLPEGVALSSVRGRAETIRKQLRQRISDHNAAVEAFTSIGRSVDGAMAKAIPTWEKRAQSQRKKLTTAPATQPVTRSRGKGTTSAAEDLAAVSPTAPAVSRVDMSYKDVTKRVPELTKGARDLLDGKITWQDYNALVDQYKPVTPYSFVPQPATAADALRALDSRKQKSFSVIQTGIQAGEPTELRLDIPAYKDHGVWVNSIHRPGQPTSYASISSIKNARMIGPDDVRLQEKALEVASGEKAKGPFAVIKGEWEPVSEKDAVARAQQYLNDPEWTQVGYDPERHSYFYDRTTTEPVVAADEVLQIGPLVLAKNAKFAKKEQFKFKDGGEVNAFIKAKAR